MERISFSHLNLHWQKETGSSFASPLSTHTLKRGKEKASRLLSSTIVKYLKSLFNISCCQGIVEFYIHLIIPIVNRDRDTTTVLPLLLMLPFPPTRTQYSGSHLSAEPATHHRHHHREFQCYCKPRVNILGKNEAVRPSTRVIVSFTKAIQSSVKFCVDYNNVFLLIDQIFTQGTLHCCNNVAGFKYQLLSAFLGNNLIIIHCG